MGYKGNTRRAKRAAEMLVLGILCNISLGNTKGDTKGIRGARSAPRKEMVIGVVFSFLGDRKGIRGARSAPPKNLDSGGPFTFPLGITKGIQREYAAREARREKWFVGIVSLFFFF